MTKRIAIGCLLVLFAAISPAIGQNIIYFNDFEPGWDDWYADNGVWDVGTPTPVPVDLPSPVNCAGTVLTATTLQRLTVA